MPVVVTLAPRLLVPEIDKFVTPVMSPSMSALPVMVKLLLPPAKVEPVLMVVPVKVPAALAVIAQIRVGNHLQLNKVKGALIRNLISPIVGVTEVRGKGLLIGIVLKSNEAKSVSEKMQQRGFLTNPASENVIRIAPAFIVTESQIMKFVTAFNDVCEEVFHG